MTEATKMSRAGKTATINFTELKDEMDKLRAHCNDLVPGMRPTNQDLIRYAIIYAAANLRKSDT